MVTGLTHFSNRASTDRKYKNKQDLNTLRDMNRDEFGEEPVVKPNRTFEDYRIRNVFQAWDHLQFRLSEMHQLPNISRKIHEFIY